MILVKGGSFMMGALDSDHQAFSEERPQHKVILNDYYISETVVTQALWKTVMGREPFVGWENRYGKGDDYPAYRVDYYDIVGEFIPKLNQLTGKDFRLPTEAEWEYAAKGGKKSGDYKYSGDNSIDSVAWYNGNSGSKPHIVKTKSPNELGIYDMSGNVWEWCSDTWYGYKSGKEVNPVHGDDLGTFRVLRGGSWDTEAGFCRVSYRSSVSSGFGIITIGFRLVLPQ